MSMRLRERVRAKLGGYFWLPCPVCGRKFGGHEIIDIAPAVTIMDVPDEPWRGHMACSVACAQHWWADHPEVDDSWRLDRLHVARSEAMELLEHALLVGDERLRRQAMERLDSFL